MIFGVKLIKLIKQIVNRIDIFILCLLKLTNMETLYKSG